MFVFSLINRQNIVITIFFLFYFLFSFYYALLAIYIVKNQDVYSYASVKKSIIFLFIYYSILSLLVYINNKKYATTKTLRELIVAYKVCSIFYTFISLIQLGVYLYSNY